MFNSPTNLLTNLSVSDLKKAIAMREKIDALTGELNSILGGSGTVAPAAKGGRGGRRAITAAGRAAIAAAQRARGAKAKAAGVNLAQELVMPKPMPTGKRRLSAATRKAMAAAAKARWAKAKAAGRSRL
jgi:hypothetical protein